MKNKFKGKTGFNSIFKNDVELQKLASEKLSKDLAMQNLAKKLNELNDTSLSDVQLKIKDYFLKPSHKTDPIIMSKSFVMCKWARDFYDCDLNYMLDISDKTLICVVIDQ